MQKAEKMQELRVFAQEIRVETLKTVGSLGFGHVPGAMSVIDALAVLYGEVMKVDPKNPHWEDRDWCVLSKGHAGPAMYATLGLKGFYPVEEAYTLNQPHTNFPSHTDRTKTPGVDLTTGSLGQGMSTATGAALGNKLDNLICFVDDNKYQLDGAVDKVMSHGKGIGAKFDAFGWNVIELQDGNDVEQIYDAVQLAYDTKGVPTCIVLNTVKGLGATFAEGTGAHSSQPSKEQWDEAIAAAEKKLAEIKAQ